MYLKNIRRALSGISLATILTLAFNPPADAATAPTARTSVCETGFRGQPAYDRACLVTGTYRDAVREWKRPYSRAERKQQCRTALRTGMASVVTETRGDMITDRYRNDDAMKRAVAWVGVRECFRIGH